MIRMLKPELGSLDGVNISLYEEGEFYDIAETKLGRAFINAGLAEKAEAPAAEAPAAEAPAAEAPQGAKNGKQGKK